MKYLIRTSILLITLLFSANINVLATEVTYINILPSTNTLEIRKDILNEELNALLINSKTGETVEVFNQNDKIIYLTKDDLDLMAKIVYAESKGEPYEGKVAVASVILNRVLSPGFPNSIKEVILQPQAFSCVVNGEINVVPTQECYDAVYDAIEGNDPTNEALFFYNPDIATCTWMQAVEKKDSKTIGQHLFFNTTY